MFTTTWVAQETAYDYRARYYDLLMGRFLSEDPIFSGINFYAYVMSNPVLFIDPLGLENCTRTPLGLVCIADNHPGTIYLDPQTIHPPTPEGLPERPWPPKPVPMPSTFCKPGTDCHDSITPGLPLPTYGTTQNFDPCQGMDFDSERMLYNGPSFECSGNKDACLDAEKQFLNACHKAGCVGAVYNGGLTMGVGAACCQKRK